MRLHRLRILMAAAIVGVVLTAQAHPGHPALSEGAAHFVMSPFHLAGALGLGAGMWMAAAFLKGQRAKLALRAVGMAVAFGGMAVWAFNG